MWKESVFDDDGGIDEAEGAAGKAEIDIHGKLAALYGAVERVGGHFGVEGDGAGAGGGACGQEDAVVGAGHQLHVAGILQREFRQVDLAGLAVAHHDAVVAHRRMLTAEAAHRHGFHAAHAAVVLDDHAGEEFQHVADLHGGHGLQPFGIHALHRRDALHGRNLILALHRNSIQLIDSVLLLRLSLQGTKHQQSAQYERPPIR